ncbi:MAG: FAD-linked oxidoreductase [Myxococcota bacterium]
MTRFRNWAGTHTCTPAGWHTPADTETVAAVVKQAHQEGQTVRVVGAGHSFSDIALTDGAMVSLDQMQSVLEADEHTGLVRVQAGLRLKRLVEDLAGLGLALPNLGSIMDQSIAGATATGTHGSSRTHGNLSSLIVGATLVTGTGEIKTLERGDNLLAARVSLGCLGIATELTLQCVPAFDLAERSWTLEFDEACDQLEALSREHEYVKLWWFPHTGRVQVFAYERTLAERRPQSGMSRWYEHNVERHLFGLVLGTGRLWPGLVPGLNRLASRSLFAPLDRVDRSDKSLTIAMPPKHREMEYSVPIEQAPEALRAMKATIEREPLRINFIVEARFVAADNAHLSPAEGRDSCQIGAYMAACPDLERYFGWFEQWMQDHQARPHWGKEFSASREYLQSVYPAFDRFDAVRQRLDPDGVMANAFVDRIFPRPPRIFPR